MNCSICGGDAEAGRDGTIRLNELDAGRPTCIDCGALVMECIEAKAEIEIANLRLYQAQSTIADRRIRSEPAC